MFTARVRSSLLVVVTTACVMSLALTSACAFPGNMSTQRSTHAQSESASSTLQQEEIAEPTVMLLRNELNDRRSALRDVTSEMQNNIATFSEEYAGFQGAFKTFVDRLQDGTGGASDITNAYHSIWKLSDKVISLEENLNQIEEHSRAVFDSQINLAGTMGNDATRQRTIERIEQNKVVYFAGIDSVQGQLDSLKQAIENLEDLVKEFEISRSLAMSEPSTDDLISSFDLEYKSLDSALNELKNQVQTISDTRVE